MINAFLRKTYMYKYHFVREFYAIMDDMDRKIRKMFFASPVSASCNASCQKQSIQASHQGP